MDVLARAGVTGGLRADDGRLSLGTRRGVRSLGVASGESNRVKEVLGRLGVFETSFGIVLVSAEDEGVEQYDVSLR